MEALGKKMDNLNAFHIDCQVSNSFIHYSDQANFVGDFQEKRNFQEPSHLEFASQEKHFDLEDFFKSYINSNETRLKNKKILSRIWRLKWDSWSTYYLRGYMKIYLAT